MTIWDDRYTTGEGLRWWPNEELVRFLGKTNLHGSRALDLGCGTGCNTWVLVAAGYQVLALDQSEEALDCARRFLSAKPEIDVDAVGLQHAVLPKIPVESNFIDLVVDCQTIQHLSWLDRAATYREIARVLKPNGMFWSMCWSGTFEAARLIYGGCYPELVNMDIGDLLDVLGDNGLEGRFPSIVTRTYPEHGSIQGEWMVVEAVKA